jgi:hypothetical protein
VVTCVWYRCFSQVSKECYNFNTRGTKCRIPLLAEFLSRSAVVSQECRTEFFSRSAVVSQECRTNYKNPGFPPFSLNDGGIGADLLLEGPPVLSETSNNPVQLFVQPCYHRHERLLFQSSTLNNPKLRDLRLLLSLQRSNQILRLSLAHRSKRDFTSSGVAKHFRGTLGVERFFDLKRRRILFCGV